MADPPVYPEDTGPGGGSTPGTPRWVKVFGIVAAVLVVLVVLMLTGVLGKGHGPGRHMGAAAGDTSSGGPASPDGATRTVEINTLDTMAFEPAGIHVSAGETVTFSVTNTGQTVHEFTLGDAAMQQQHADAMTHMPTGMAHDTPNSITMQPGEAKRLTWRFGEVASLEFACHQPGHYEAGMRGQIAIT